MKLKEVFTTEAVDNEHYMVCLDSSIFSGMIQLNETAAFIIECLKSDTTLDDIVKKMVSEYEVDEDLATQGAVAMIKQLKSINALEL